MTASMWARLLSVAAVAAVVSAPSVARAQQTLDSVTVLAQRRAEDLYQKAVALQGEPRTWRQAAYLHQMSAALRTAEDPKGDESLRLGAHLMYHLGDRQAARSMMERAASRAQARGDVVQAANGYVDAAHVALEQRSAGQAGELGRRAMTLASSPLITAAQRADIVRRIRPELQTAMANAR
jgi:hypothetical protein